MKSVLFMITVFLFSPATAHAQSSTSRSAIAEVRQIQSVRQDFFNAIAASDYQGMREQCAPDFQLLENGEVMDVEGLINLVKAGGGKTRIVYSFEDIRTRIEGQSAWSSYRNRAVVTRGDKTSSVEWLESAVFVRKNGRWKMVLLHSTVVKPKN